MAAKSKRTQSRREERAPRKSAARRKAHRSPPSGARAVGSRAHSKALGTRAKRLKKGAAKKAMTSDSSEDKLEKVRDLLFGSEAQKSEKRFGQIEARLSRDLTEVRKDLEKRMDSLEEYVRAELATLGQRLAAEKAEREAAAKELGGRVTETGRALGKRITALQEEFTAGLREQRKGLLEQSKELRGEIEAGRTESGAELEEALAEIRGVQLTRTDLAALLAELAMRLGGKAGQG